MEHKKPTKEDLLNAVNKTVPNVIKPNLKVLFVGINPGLYTAAIGHHFGRPGNRFWPALYSSGFTPALFSPYDSEKLLDLNLGITNLVARATVSSAELTKEELVEGVKILEKLVTEYTPEWVAILGVDAYRKAYGQGKAKMGVQERKIGKTKIWVGPNPSGLNAHFTPNKLTEVFNEFKIITNF